MMSLHKPEISKLLLFVLCLNKERMPHFFDRLHEAMEILVEFFTLDGSGLTGRKLYTEQYHEVEMFFNLNKVKIRSII